MELMYPSRGPKKNDSNKAEPLVYKLLKEQLDDNYHVIHSIPWLSSFVRDALQDKSNIGEVDFLIIHKTLGLLAIEVKGGALKHDLDGFYYSLDSGLTISRTDPVSQLGRGVFALQSWFQENGIQTRIARAFCFPDSEIPLNKLPPGYFDFNQHQGISLVLDKRHIPELGSYLTKIMESHRTNLGSQEFNDYQVQKMIDMIVPTINSSPCWISRVKEDNYLWLKLTEEQKECVSNALKSNKFIVNGWPGSGKTIVAIQVARNLAKSGKRVLTITFNRLLAEKLNTELKEYSDACDVFTLYKIYLKIDKVINKKSIPDNNNITYENQNFSDQYLSIINSLQKAEEVGLLDEYDCLIVDEGQVIPQQAWESLSSIFKYKKIIVMCDATQAFEYEKPISLEWLESSLKVKAYTLTSSLRVPKKVCDRLKIFTKPHYTVHNPRNYEEDTLLELVVSNPKNTLQQLISQLLVDNIPPHYITVLKPATLKVPENLVPTGIRIENIGRFRGLESPIVVVFADPKMSNTDFFIAYSRATSKCICIFEAYHVKTKDYGAIGPELYETNPSDVDEKIAHSFTHELFKEIHLESTKIHKSLPIYWCAEWAMYVLRESDSENELIRSLMEVYLRTNSTPRVATWHRESRKTLSIISTDKLEYDRFFSGEMYELQGCPTCGIMTPHNLQVFDGEPCLVCSSEDSFRDRSFEKELRSAGEVVGLQRQTTSQEREELDASLYIIGAFKKISSAPFSDEVISAINHPTKAINRLALGYSLCFIYRNIRKGIFRFKIKEVTAATHEWNSNISNWKKQSWNAYVNDAFRILALYELVTSETSGSRKVNIKKFLKE